MVTTHIFKFAHRVIAHKSFPAGSLGPLDQLGFHNWGALQVSTNAIESLTRTVIGNPPDTCTQGGDMMCGTCTLCTAISPGPDHGNAPNPDPNPNPNPEVMMSA